MSYLLLTCFFCVAVIHSVAGFGGGSSYLALMALFGISTTIIPVIALACNIVVTACGTSNFVNARQMRWSLVWPYLIMSVPFSYLGGLTPVREEVYLLLLAGLLFLSSLRIVFANERNSLRESKRLPPARIAAIIGALLGYLSGVVGIGGGVFLSPILLTRRWGNPKQVAATCSLFILLNSAAGLLGQLQKLQLASNLLASVAPFALLLPAVFVGGFLGSYLSASKFSQRAVANIIALLLFLVSIRLTATEFIHVRLW